MGIDFSTVNAEPKYSASQVMNANLFYELLPAPGAPGMPPEVETLVEMKSLVELSGSEEAKAWSQEAFMQQFVDLEANGGLDIVTDYIRSTDYFDWVRQQQESAAPPEGLRSGFRSQRLPGLDM